MSETSQDKANSDHAKPVLFQTAGSDSLEKVVYLVQTEWTHSIKPVQWWLSIRPLTLCQSHKQETGMARSLGTVADACFSSFFLPKNIPLIWSKWVFQNKLNQVFSLRFNADHQRRFILRSRDVAEWVRALEMQGQTPCLHPHHPGKGLACDPNAKVWRKTHRDSFRLTS